MDILPFSHYFEFIGALHIGFGLIEKFTNGLSKELRNERYRPLYDRISMLRSNLAITESTEANQGEKSLLTSVRDIETIINDAKNAEEADTSFVDVIRPLFILSAVFCATIILFDGFDQFIRRLYFTDHHVGIEVVKIEPSICPTTFVSFILALILLVSASIRCFLLKKEMSDIELWLWIAGISLGCFTVGLIPALQFELFSSPSFQLIFMFFAILIVSTVPFGIHKFKAKRHNEKYRILCDQKLSSKIEVLELVVKNASNTVVEESSKTASTLSKKLNRSQKK